MEFAIFYNSLIFKKRNGGSKPPPYVYSAKLSNIKMIFKFHPFVGYEIANS